MHFFSTSMTAKAVQPGPTRSRRLLVAFVSVTALAVTLAGCSGGSPKASATATKHDSLTVGISAAPTTLDPALVTINQSIITDLLAYDPLIYQGTDGSYQPDLATTWKYVGTGNTEFTMTLRDGVTFSDGTAFDAKAVKTWLEYARDVAKNGKIAKISSIEIPDAHTVDIKLSAPDPDLPWVFSQNGAVGLVASPAAVANPSLMSTGTAGTGQYVLNKDSTVTRSKYVYAKNPKYWNPSAVQFDTVTATVFENPSSLLSAMQTGQIAVGIGDPTTAASAKAAKAITVDLAPGAQVANIWLNDRAGKLIPALGSAAVRQALNYAVDRKAIAEKLYGGLAQPTTQNATATNEGYSTANDTMYPYDPTKAKALLAQAGYGSGFDMSLMCTPPDTTACNVSNAVASYWNAIGIRTTVDAEPSLTAFLPKLATAPASINGTGNTPTFTGGGGWISAKSPRVNPQSSQDSELNSLFDLAATQPDTERTQTFQKFITALVAKAWFVPLVNADYIYYVNGSLVSNVNVTATQPMWNPVAPNTTNGWR
jgi:peptide/nickel transport system substrate-binding protein